jgi:endonuclease YncB( thermonuclease family)
MLKLPCSAGLAWKPAPIISGIVNIAGGVTITVLEADKLQHKLRLAGVDAPEKKQAYRNPSKQSLSDMVFDKFVKVETDKKDRYERDVGKVLVGGTDVNQAQVQRGTALHCNLCPLWIDCCTQFATSGVARDGQVPGSPTNKRT